MSETTNAIATLGRIVTEGERDERFGQLVKDLRDVYRKHLGISEIMPMNLVKEDGTVISNIAGRYLTVCGIPVDYALAPVIYPDRQKDSSLECAEAMLVRHVMPKLLVDSMSWLQSLLYEEHQLGYGMTFEKWGEHIEHQG